MQTADLQREFADFCRTGEGDQPPRVAIYRNLVFNNIYTCLSNVFPLSKKAVEETEWREMVVSFFAEHKLSHPQFWRMPLEFVQPGPRPYLEDLLRFEALDYEVNLMADSPVPLYTLEGDVIESRLILNPEHRFAHFCYPVYKVSSEELEEMVEGSYYLILFRHPETLRVQVVELSPFYRLVLELLREEPLSGREVLELAAQHFEQLKGKNLFASGREFLESLLEERALLGFASQA